VNSVMLKQVKIYVCISSVPVGICACMVCVICAGIFLENKYRGEIKSFENRGVQNFNHIKINFIIEA